MCRGCWPMRAETMETDTKRCLAARGRDAHRARWVPPKPVFSTSISPPTCHISPIPHPWLAFRSQSPQPMSYHKYLEHVDTTMGADTPIAFGLHPNAEIDFRTQQSEVMFKVKPRLTATTRRCHWKAHGASMITTSSWQRMTGLRRDLDRLTCWCHTSSSRRACPWRTKIQELP